MVGATFSDVHNARQNKVIDDSRLRPCNKHSRPARLPTGAATWRTQPNITSTDYFAPARVRNIAIGMSLCLSVSLLAYLKNHMPKFHEILYTWYFLPWLGPSLDLMSQNQRQRYVSLKSTGGGTGAKLLSTIAGLLIPLHYIKNDIIYKTKSTLTYCNVFREGSSHGHW